VEHRLREEGVKIHFYSEIGSIIEKRGKVAGVITKGGEKIKCQMLAIAIGIRPRKELGEGIGLQIDRGILVNEYLQTTIPNIYAAGDVAQAFDPITGNYIIDSLWGPAREQGRVAGANMAGSKRTYLKSVPFNVTRLAGLTTTIIGTVGKGLDEDLLGIARGDSETWRQLPDAIAAQSDFDVNRLRILVGKKSLLGALVMGDQTLSQPLQKLISQQVNITDIRDKLLNANGNLSEILINFWSAWSEQNAAHQ
jgi:NADPH-dependent 2,4-dienoyl-CoA reductase/sulfur reductase-like enzyme